MKDNAMIATFAKAFTSHSWSQGMGMFGLGDTVAKRNTQANVDSSIRCWIATNCANAQRKWRQREAPMTPRKQSQIS